MKIKRKAKKGVAAKASPKAKAAKKAPASKGVVDKNTINTELFDKHVIYVGKGMRMTDIRKSACGRSTSKLTQDGFLVVRGDKPGMLVHPVKWDGKDVYKRGDAFGSMIALNSSANKQFRSEIISKTEMLKRLKANNKVVDLNRVETGKRVTVALFGGIEDPYFAGVTVERGRLRVLNMEPVAHYNKPPVQFNDPKEVNMSATKLLSEAA